MIYRNRNELYFPQEVDAQDPQSGEVIGTKTIYQRESMKSINAAKGRVRREKLLVRGGLPPKTVSAKDGSRAS